MSDNITEFFRDVAPHIGGVIEMGGSQPIEIVDELGQEVTTSEIMRRLAETVSFEQAQAFAKKADCMERSADGNHVFFIDSSPDSDSDLTILTLTRQQAKELGLTIDK